MDLTCLFKCSPRRKHLPQPATIHLNRRAFAAPLGDPSESGSEIVGTLRPRLFLVRFGIGTGAALRTLEDGKSKGVEYKERLEEEGEVIEYE